MIISTHSHNKGLFLNDSILDILKAGGIRGLKISIPQCDEVYLISLFDDDFFTQIDFDIIDGKTRNLMTDLLRKKGYQIKSSREFISPNNEIYLLPKPSHTLGCNPADKLFDTIQKGTATFCTPTQCLLYFATIKDNPFLNEEFLKSFLMQQPVNVKKVVQWINHDRLKPNFPYSEKQLTEWCEKYF